MARHVAEIKRGRKSIEEKAEAIGRFVTNFSLGNRAGGDRAAKRVLLPPISRIRASLEAPSIPPKAARTPAAKAEEAAQSAEVPVGLRSLFSPDMEVQSAKRKEADLDREAAVTSLDEVMHKLHTDTILFLHTADTLAAALREYDLDWSPAVIMLCKAFEKETNVRLLVPLRDKSCGRDLKADMSDEDLGRIARFCSAAGQPPELGTLGRFLNTAIHSKRRRASSILLQSFYELLSDWPRSQWLVDEFGLEAALKRLTKEFRNPAAHIEKLSENEFGKWFRIGFRLPIANQNPSCVNRSR
jgi:hypothetical protein